MLAVFDMEDTCPARCSPGARDVLMSCGRMASMPDRRPMCTIPSVATTLLFDSVSSPPMTLIGRISQELDYKAVARFIADLIRSAGLLDRPPCMTAIRSDMLIAST